MAVWNCAPWPAKDMSVRLIWKRPAGEQDRDGRPINDIVNRVIAIADDAGSSDARCSDSLCHPGRGGEGQFGG